MYPHQFKRALRDSPDQIKNYENFFKNIVSSTKNIYISEGMTPDFLIYFNDVITQSNIDNINEEIENFNPHVVYRAQIDAPTYASTNTPIQSSVLISRFKPFKAESKRLYIALIIDPQSQIGIALENRLKAIYLNKTFFETYVSNGDTTGMRVNKIPHMSLLTLYIPGESHNIDFEDLCGLIKILFSVCFHTNIHSNIIQANSPFAVNNSNYELFGDYVGRSYKGGDNNQNNYLKSIQFSHDNSRDNLLFSLINSNTPMV